MSIVSTNEIAALYKKNTCIRLGVEDFECLDDIEMTRDPDAVTESLYHKKFLWIDEKNKEEQKFYSPVFKWKVNGEWFQGAVPIKLTTRVEHNFFSSHYYAEEDWVLMEAELIKMIERSKVSGADEVL
jgi:hypothetical protein